MNTKDRILGNLQESYVDGYITGLLDMLEKLNDYPHMQSYYKNIERIAKRFPEIMSRNHPNLLKAQSGKDKE